MNMACGRYYNGGPLSDRGRKRGKTKLEKTQGQEMVKRVVRVLTRSAVAAA